MAKTSPLQHDTTSRPEASNELLFIVVRMVSKNKCKETHERLDGSLTQWIEADRVFCGKKRLSTNACTVST